LYSSCCSDNRIRESVPKSHTPASHIKGPQLIAKSEDVTRPRVITEDACLRPQNFQSTSPRLVSGDGTCTISRDYQEDSLDNCHPVREQALYQTIYSLPGETMLARGESTAKYQTPALHRQQSHLIVKSEDFRRARVITEDACLRPQNFQSPRPSPRLVSGDATCTISRDYQEDSLDNCHPVKEQALYQTIYSLPGETMLARGESTAKLQTPALHRQQSQLIVKSEDFRRARLITEDACLRPQNSQPSPRLVSGDATCTVSRDYQEDSLHNLNPAKEQDL
jgi:hypothetical protein